jgi:uncharacterized membrane protein (DUF485 family)
MAKYKNYILLLLFGVVAFFYFTINPNEVDFMLKCPLYSTTGVYCPGCGSQRAAHHLLHFDILKAAQNNILFLIAIIGVLYHYSIPLLNSYFHKNYKSIFDNTRNLWIALVLIVIFWVLRNIPYYPFTLLAPGN